MKISLEPIPPEQVVGVQPSRPTGEPNAADAASVEGVRDGYPVMKNTGQIERAYPWLLGASTCLCALLCWMYVTKPVIIQKSITPQVLQADQQVRPPEPAPAKSTATAAAPTAAELVPSDSLPSSTNKLAAGEHDSSKKVDPDALASAQRGVAKSDVTTGWEKTNLKVQHILSADSGSGEHEKIVINVPVLYETRSMRWTPEKVQKARDVLGRLMLYEQSLSNLRKEGVNILADWNQIIKETIPANYLRADSPSLPYNHGLGNEPTVLPGSSSVIQVEDK